MQRTDTYYKKDQFPGFISEGQSVQDLYLKFNILFLQKRYLLKIEVKSWDILWGM